MQPEPQLGDVWRNIKHSTYYLVTGLSKHHRTGETMVNYQDGNGQSYVRELTGVEDCWYNRFAFVERLNYSGITSEGGDNYGN